MTSDDIETTHEEFAGHLLEAGGDLRAWLFMDFRDEIMGLARACTLSNATVGNFFSLTVVPAGQWSLTRESPMVVLGRVHLLWRPIRECEAMDDFEGFGEQVMGEEDEGGPILFFEKRYAYTGPRRLKKLYYALRTHPLGEEVLQQSVIAKLAGELSASYVDELEPAEWILVHADQGVISAAVSSELPQVADLQRSGTLSIKGGRMLLESQSGTSDKTEMMW